MENASTSVLTSTSFQSSVSEASTSRQKRTRFWVTHGGRTENICCYDSASPGEIEHLLRSLFAIPPRYNIVLRNEAGDAVVMSPKLPNMSSFVLEIRDQGKKKPSHHSPARTMRTPPVSEASTSTTTAQSTPQQRKAATGANAQTPDEGEETSQVAQNDTSGEEGAHARSSPSRGSDSQRLNFSIATTIAHTGEEEDDEEESVGDSTVQEDSRVEEAASNTREQSVADAADRGNSSSVAADETTAPQDEAQPTRSYFSPETPATSQSAVSLTRHSSMLLNESSASKLKMHTSQSPMMQSFKYVERLEIFLKSVLELKQRSLSDFFKEDPETAEVFWRRHVSQPEFLAVFSSDLYARANACDLLDSEDKRRDVDSVFQAALSAYAVSVRDLITSSRSDSSPLMSAEHCKQALQAAFDAACKTIKSRSRAMVDQALSNSSPASLSRLNSSSTSSSTASPALINVQSPAAKM